jgi:hypothetical protein
MVIAFLLSYLNTYTEIKTILKMSNSTAITVTDIVYSLSNIQDALVPSPIQGAMQLPLTHIKVKAFDWEVFLS